MVRSGSVTGSPKASPGCNGEGAAGPLAGGMGSLGLGFDGAGAFWAPPEPPLNAKAKINPARASLKGDITVLRQVRRSGDSPASVCILAWPLANPRLFAI